MKIYRMCGIHICLSFFILLLAVSGSMAQPQQVQVKLAWDPPVDENSQPFRDFDFYRLYSCNQEIKKSGAEVKCPGGELSSIVVTKEKREAVISHPVRPTDTMHVYAVTVNTAGNESDLSNRVVINPSDWVVINPSTDPKVPLLITLPVTLQAENYSTGGEGVDIRQLGDNNSAVSLTADDEWLAYQVEMPQDDIVSIVLHYATAPGVDKVMIRLEVDGEAFTESVSLLGTGKETSIVGASLGKFLLKKGKRLIRLVVEKAPVDFDKIVFSKASQ
jgi:hypothetical protein